MLGTVPAVAVKLAVAPPAATITEAGIVSAALFEESATEAPPASAAGDTVTVQVLFAPESIKLGEHKTLETAGSGVTVTEAAALPFRVAVRLTV